jgi:D-alanyl-D-alanine carboxypeptidase
VKAPGLLAAVVIGGSLVLAAATFAFVGELLRGAGESGTREIVDRLEAEVADLSRELRLLRGEVEALNEALSVLQEAGVARPSPPLAAMPAPAPAPLALDQFGGTAPPPETEALIDQMQLASDRFNRGVERPRPSVLRELLGDPRQAYSQDCQPVTNPRLVQALETREVASFRLTMLRPALDSLETVIERLRREEPEIYAALGTAGALCARYVRGSASSVSSHAWGAAVDLTLTGSLDRMGDASTQFGLVVLAEFFNEAGWYWGAGYGREDSMHFEVGEALLRQWIAEGKL